MVIAVISGAARVFIAGAKPIGVSIKMFLDHALYFGYKCDQLYSM